MPEPAQAPELAPVEQTTGAEVSAEGELVATPEGAVDPLDAEKSEEDSAMIVTGSRIKRTSFDTPTPVQVYDREAIARTGATNMGDLVRVLTANSGSESQFGLGGGSTGAAQFNLRGLGLANTLVLLNGRRLVPYPDAFGVTNAANFSDINQIPLAFIERIEIAKGGASAIYGSDAIAGVVNIILRKSFEGMAVTLNGQTTDKWDQQDGEVATIFGARSDKSSLIGQISYFQRSPLAARDRKFTKGTLTSTVGFPGTFVLPDTTGMGRPATYRVDPGCGEPGTTSSLDRGATDSENDDRCRFDFRDDWNLFNKEKRLLGYMNASHEVAPFFELFAEFGFAYKRTEVPQSPSYPLLRSATVPATHVDNPYGQTAVFLGRPFGRPYGSALQRIDLDGYRVVGGIRGDLDKAKMPGWSYELSTTWHLNQFMRRNDDILFDKFQTALNSCSNPNNLTGCFNPFYTAIDGTGTQNSLEVLDKITGQVKAQTISKMLVGDFSLGGPIVELPGGDLALAVGAQYRGLEQSLDADNEFNEAAYAFTIGNKDWRGKQNVVAGFAELSVPFWKGIELQGAVRAEHYQNIQTTVNPRGALSWALGKSFRSMPAAIGGLRLRGSVGTAFRAPNLLQTNGTLVNLEQFVDPAPVFRGVQTAPNTDLKPEKSLAFSGGLEYLFKGLSADLDYWQYNITDLIIRQNAQQLLATCRGAMMEAQSTIADTPECDAFVLTPGTSNWESVMVTYNNQDKIKTNGLDFMLGYRLGLGASGGELNLGIGGTYVLSYMVPTTAVPKLNVANNDTSAGAPATRRIDQDGCKGSECDLAGKRNQNNFAPPMPRLRMRVPVSWGLKGHAISLAINYISGYDDDATYNAMSGKMTGIDAWTTVDLGYSYSLTKTPIGASTQFRVGVNNLIGSDPPKLSAATNFGYDIYVHDPRKRLLYANITHKF